MRRLALERIGLAPGSRPGRPSHVLRLAVLVLLVAAGHYAGGLVGLSIRFPPAGISIIWPPNAILLAALLLAPPRAWWLYLLAAAPIHWHLVTHFQPGVPAVIMLCQFAGNALQAVVGALAVRRFVGTRPRFDSLRSMTIFIILAGVAAPAVASALVASVFVLTGWAADYWLLWRQRVLTNVVPTLTIAPLIVSAFAGGVVSVRDINAPSRKFLPLPAVRNSSTDRSAPRIQP